MSKEILRAIAWVFYGLGPGLIAGSLMSTNVVPLVAGGCIWALGLGALAWANTEGGSP